MRAKDHGFRRESNQVDDRCHILKWFGRHFRADQPPRWSREGIAIDAVEIESCRIVSTRGPPDEPIEFADRHGFWGYGCR